MLMLKIRASFARVMAWLLVPIRLLDGNLTSLDRLLGRELTIPQVNAIAQACHAGGRRFGAYYHWKFRQIAQVATMRTLDRDEAIALVRSNDHSEYGPLDDAMADPRGLLIAIPHHGHYLQGIIAMCERLQVERDVFVFYESPEAHETNAIFDVIHERVFGSAASKVSILHNNRVGLVRALKELRKGNVVFILPDVFKHVEDTYRVPFCGMQRDFMLGSAVIARRSNARILPVVAQPTQDLFGFANQFGTQIEAGQTDGSPEGDLHADYRATLGMFRTLEPLMEDSLFYWQYAYSHQPMDHASGANPVDVSPAILLQDPYINLSQFTPIQI